MTRLPLATALLLGLAPAARSEVVIHEIMYHPSSERTDEEFIELHNTGPAAVDLSGWQFSSGVTFTIPAGTTLDAGGFLVAAADAAAFAAKYPAAPAPVAGWSGILSNSSNRVTLRDAAGTVVDEVRYTDDGDWAVRQKDVVADHGHRGWGWDSGADGLGSSLELVQPLLDNSSGQNWAASTVPHGTPGAANSTAASDVAPLILDAAHFPLVPGPDTPVHVTARLLDDHGALATASVHYRLDGDPAFTAVPLADDGAHGDTLPGDGIFGATLPVQADGSIIEFYFSAADAAGHTRTWPALALDQNGVSGQAANCLYQVDATPYAAAMPLYRFVMRAVDRAELAAINASGTSENESHALMNATFISLDGTGSELRYRCGVRNRGNSSRSALPQSFRINFLEQQPWDGVAALNLNTQQTPYQLLGSIAFRRAGLTSAAARAVQLRVNGTNPASATGAPAHGFYVANEVIDSRFAGEHYPLDSSGNAYRVLQVNYNSTDPGGDLGDWSDHPDPALADPAPYRVHYFKRTNTSEDDWSDLIRLTQVLAKGRSPSLNSPNWDADYAAAVRQVVDVTQWMRYFAANTIADTTETCFANGRGDDYSLYLGRDDPRARLIPYDLDSIFGRSSGSSTTHSLWQMCQNPSVTGSPPTPVNPFMKHPEFAPLYYAELKRMIDGAFAPANFNPLVDEVLGGLVAPSVASAIKTFNAGRTAWIAGQIPLALSVTTAPAAQNGYPRTTTATAALGGAANALTTRSVTVNGTPAAWTAWSASWAAPAVALHPGVNHVLIQSFDADGIETARLGYDVWFDDATTETAPATITADTTWTAAGGPWQVGADLTVEAGATLTIEAGASVYFAGGADLVVAAGGRILAEGTATAPVRFLRPPGSTSAWGTLTINGGAGSPASRIAHARFDGGGSPAIDVNAGDVELDHLQFGNTGAQYLSLDGASFVVSHCHFPTPTAAFEPVHGTAGVKAGGRGIIRHCFFGAVNGYNDVIGFTGGQRPGPILQVLDNVFTGSGDDILELDGTDTWIERNIFLHVHKNGAPDSAAAVSGGSSGGNVSRVTILGNLFYDIDHALTAKQGNFYTLLNNTIIRQTIDGGNEVDGGVINMRDPLPDPPTTWGLGCYAAGNVIADAQKLIREFEPAATTVTLDSNLLPSPWAGAGSNNTIGDPLFVRVPELAETWFADWHSAQVLREWLAPGPGSPARGAGPGGRDLGGVIAPGVHVSGAPSGTTNLDSATLTVGPLFTAGIPWASGFTHYVWRLDGGPWSAETPADTPLQLTGLAPGEHYVEASGRNDAGFYQDDPAFGESATPTRTASWTVDPGYTPPTPVPLVRINEVLASNSETLGYSGTFPDLIELHNAGNAPADLAGWGLTDNSALPYKFTFPAGTTLAAGAYLLVHASGAAAVPAPKTGFGLKTEGDTLTLTRSAAAGGGVADVIAFGAQLPDFALGRRATDGGWDLCVPTFGTANIVSARAPAAALRLNEWLASPGALFATDFIELFNPSTLPVDVGGGFLTDNPTDWPDRHPLRPFTFVAPGGFAVFKADGDPQQGPDHLSFGLAASQGEIGLFDPALGLIDRVVYGPQTTGVSQGRSPNGSGGVVSFPQPTPGSPNPYSAGAAGTVVTELIPVNAAWKYMSSGTSYQGSFQAAGFDDSGWPSGGQLHYIGGSSLTSPSGFAKTTAVPGNPANSSRPYATTYFRRHFTYNGPPTGVTLRATMMLDDGAVIYLNGQEATRVRMPTGSVGFSTYANTTVSQAAEETITIPATNLLPGDNVIAVEVHQVNATSSDVVFGIKLVAEYGATNISTTNLIASGAEWKYSSAATDYQGLFQAPAFDDAGWPTGGQLLHIEDATLSSPSGMTKTTALPGDPANSNGPFGTTYFRRHFEWNGPLDNLTLRARLMLDDGAVIYLNGHEATRIRMNAGTPAFATLSSANVDNATEETVVIPADHLQAGDNVIAVEVHQSAATSSDVVFGMRLDAEVVTARGAQVVLNEVLVDNPAAAGPPGAWIELHNPSGTATDLTDMSLTDAIGDARRWVFPAGTIVDAGAYLVVRCDPANPAGPDNTGFALDPAGGGLHLFDAPAVGGGLRDSVSFGHQLPDHSVGRVPNATGAFTLNLPTPAALNQAAALAPASAVVINEWLAAPADPPDWFELHNTASLPVLLGGHFLTDTLSNRTMHPLPPLTFIGASGATRWLQLIADSDGGRPGHVNFKLRDAGEALGLFTAAGVQLAAVAFGAQATGVSEGSFPDGAATIVAMPPTPGAANAQFTPDRDGDGMPDAWESAHGLNPDLPDDAALDADGDGQSNLAEFIAGTDPQDPASRLAAAATLDASGRPLLRFHAVAGRSYTIAWANEPTGPWNSLTDIAAQAADGMIEVSDTDPAAGPRRFYRLITPAQP